MTGSLQNLLFRTVLGSVTVKGAQLTALTQAADTLATRLEGARGEVTRVALNAFLPEGHLSALQPVHEALTLQWPTFASEIPDGGLPYLRAAAIMALLQHANDDELGSALYLLLVDPLMRQGDAREAELRKEVLAQLKSTYQKSSAEAWLGVEVNVPNVTVKTPGTLAMNKTQISTARETIDTALRSTSVGTYYDRYGSENRNMQVAQPWATAVSTAITETLETLLGQTIVPLATAIGAPLKDVAKFSPALSEALRTAKLAGRRMDVMWWMQARYSPSLEVPYRTLGPIPAAFRMAHDLNDLVTTPAPPEVEAVLLEAWHILFGEPKPELLLNLLKMVTTGDPSSKGVWASSAGGYVDLLDAIAAVGASPRISQKQLSALTGVAGNTLLSGPELALWFLRTYQARELLQ